MAARCSEWNCFNSCGPAHALRRSRRGSLPANASAQRTPGKGQKALSTLLQQQQVSQLVPHTLCLSPCCPTNRDLHKYSTTRTPNRRVSSAAGGTGRDSLKNLVLSKMVEAAACRSRARWRLLDGVMLENIPDAIYCKRVSIRMSCSAHVHRGQGFVRWGHVVCMTSASECGLLEWAQCAGSGA